MVATPDDCSMPPYDPLEHRAPTDFFPDDEYYNSSNDSEIDAIHKEMDREASEGEDSDQATGREDEGDQESLESEEDAPSVPTSTRLKITIPARLVNGNGKRKPMSPLEITSESGSASDSGPDTLPLIEKVIPGKKQLAKKARLQAQPVENQNARPKCRGRGRPKKSVATLGYTIPVYIKIAQPPRLVRERTSKGDKYKLTEPKTEGPFTMSDHMSWDRFLSEIADCAGVEKENMDPYISAMTWCVQQRSPLPLTSSDGYNAMRRHLSHMKNRDSAIISKLELSTGEDALAGLSAVQCNRVAHN